MQISKLISDLETKSLARAELISKLISEIKIKSVLKNMSESIFNYIISMAITIFVIYLFSLIFIMFFLPIANFLSIIFGMICGIFGAMLYIELEKIRKDKANKQ